jgi:hypothetical protein
MRNALNASNAMHDLVLRSDIVILERQLMPHRPNHLRGNS